MESNEKDAGPALRIGIGPTSKQKLEKFAMAEPHTAWGFVVERYNTRSLTNDLDAFPAIARIPSVMEAFLKDTFFYNLPMKSLWVGLLWRSQQGLRRRKVTRPGAEGAHIDNLLTLLHQGLVGTAHIAHEPVVCACRLEGEGGAKKQE
jgi:hypothetical protein